MSYIYLASPYTHEDEAVMELRFVQVVDAASYLISVRLLHVFSPIAHCHALAVRHTLPRDAQFWNDYNYTFLKHAKQVCILTIDGWQRSKGIQAEIQTARHLNIPIAFTQAPNYLLTNSAQ